MSPQGVASGAAVTVEKEARLAKVLTSASVVKLLQRGDECIGDDNSDGAKGRNGGKDESREGEGGADSCGGAGLDRGES